MTLWTPADLVSAPSLWLDADDETTITLDSNRVTRINSKYGNIYATQGVSAKCPLLISAAQNGKDVLRFDGSDDFMAFTNAGGIAQNKSNLHIFTVRKITNFTTQRFLFFASTNKTSGRLVVGAEASTLGRLGGRRLDSDEFMFDNIARDTNYHIEAGHFSYSAALWTYRLDGVAITTTFKDSLDVYSPTKGNTSNTASEYVTLGANANGSLYFFMGDVAEILIIDGVISDDDRYKIEGYLAHKWGLSDNLDAEHIYKSTPPTWQIDGLTLNLAVQANAFDYFKMILEVLEDNWIEDFKLNLDVVAQVIDSFKMLLEVVFNELDDFKMLLEVTDGTVFDNFAMLLEVTDGTVFDNFKMELSVVSATPAFRSVTAHRVSSVLHEVV